MSYSVLLVEDEPAALRYVRTIIDTHCQSFTVSGTAENGAEGLSQVERHRPDLVVTDARMPVMDGIEMVQRLRELNDDTPILVLSGYDDFEYVRGALDTGVVDYILKPISVQRLRSALESLLGRLSERRDRTTAEWLYGLLTGKASSGNAAPSPVPVATKCHIALLRHGGLVGRSETRPAAVDFERVGDILAVRGRDERESLLFAASQAVDSPRFHAALESLRSTAPSFLSTAGYYTMGAFPRPAGAEELPSAVEWLTGLVDSAIRPGAIRWGVRDGGDGRGAGNGGDSGVSGNGSGVQAGDSRGSGVQADDARLGDVLIERLEYGISGENPQIVEEAVTEIVEGWNSTEPSLSSVRRAISAAILHIAGGAVDPAEIDLRIDEAMETPATYEEIGASLKQIVLEQLKPELLENEADGAPGFFKAIRKYVAQNYRLQLSLNSVSEHFGLSASYVSRLFRRYEGITLGEFLTKRRIEVAQELLSSPSQISIKELAGYCGFNDQYYFSRVFKASTGQSPTVYRDSYGSST